MHVLTPADLEAMFAPAMVMTLEKLLRACDLPRRNPITHTAAILGGMVDAWNRALLDACPDPACAPGTVASVDFSGLIASEDLVAQLFALICMDWPDATMNGMKISAVIPEAKASIRLSA